MRWGEVTRRNGRLSWPYYRSHMPTLWHPGYPADEITFEETRVAVTQDEGTRLSLGFKRSTRGCQTRWRMVISRAILIFFLKCVFRKTLSTRVVRHRPRFSVIDLRESNLLGKVPRVTAEIWPGGEWWGVLCCCVDSYKYSVWRTRGSQRARRSDVYCRGGGRPAGGAGRAGRAGRREGRARRAAANGGRPAPPRP